MLATWSGAECESARCAQLLGRRELPPVLVEEAVVTASRWGRVAAVARHVDLRERGWRLLGRHHRTVRVGDPAHLPGIDPVARGDVAQDDALRTVRAPPSSGRCGAPPRAALLPLGTPGYPVGFPVGAAGGGGHRVVHSIRQLPEALDPNGPAHVDDFDVWRQLLWVGVTAFAGSAHETKENQDRASHEKTFFPFGLCIFVDAIWVEDRLCTSNILPDREFIKKINSLP